MKPRTKKIVLLTFLAFIVIGFTAPLVSYTFFEGDPQDASTPEQIKNPKFCSKDSDCTLTCPSNNDPIVCIQNICAQTECDQTPLFYYSQIPTKFTLDILINTTPLPSHLPLIVDQKNTFVQTQGSQVSVYSTDLPLIGVLEKIGVTFNQNCMVYHTQQYCQDENNVLDLRINGNATDLGYIPSDDDVIILSYSKVQPKNLSLDVSKSTPKVESQANNITVSSNLSTTSNSSSKNSSTKQTVQN